MFSRLKRLPLAPVAFVVVVAGASVIWLHATHTIHSGATYQVADVVTATALPTDTATVAPATPTATAAPAPTATSAPISTATPTAVPTATLTPAPTPNYVNQLAISPVSETVVCDNHHYQSITISNTGTMTVGWNTQSSPSFATYPSSSYTSGTSLLAPGESQQTMPDGIGGSGTVWTVTVYQEDPNSQLGPQVGTVTITCS